MRLLVLLALVLAPMQASALSCMRPSVARSYLEAAKAEEEYVVVKGHLTFDAGKLPNKGGQLQNDMPPMTRIPARLRGLSLSKSGFDLPFDRKLTLEVACFGPWCGRAPKGTEVLAFVRRDAGNYALWVDPCGSLLFEQPKRAQIKELTTCHAGGACDPDAR